MDKIFKSCSPKYTNEQIGRMGGVKTFRSYVALLNKSINEAIGKKENEKIVGMVMDQDGITFIIETEK